MELTGNFYAPVVTIGTMVGSLALAAGCYRLEFTYLKCAGGAIIGTQSAVYCVTTDGGTPVLFKTQGNSELSVEAAAAGVNFVSYMGDECALTVFWKWFKADRGI